MSITECHHLAARLAEHKIIEVPGRYAQPSDAWQAATRITAEVHHRDPLSAGLPDLEVVGEFVVPPPGTVQRDFQALHLDFGLPRATPQPVSVARFTALHCAAEGIGSGAATRVVPLAELFSRRSWPAQEDLCERLRMTTDDDPAEGVLARIVAAVDRSDDLPAKDADGFLCGMEFDSVEAEHRYFSRHDLPLSDAERQVVLSPGDLLIFDNLAIAHGRRGRRQPSELHQLCIGFRSLDQSDQATLLDRVLASLTGTGLR
jgi:hypothetical protein